MAVFQILSVPRPPFPPHFLLLVMLGVEQFSDILLIPWTFDMQFSLPEHSLTSILEDFVVFLSPPLLTWFSSNEVQIVLQRPDNQPGFHPGLFCSNDSMLQAGPDSLLSHTFAFSPFPILPVRD